MSKENMQEQVMNSSKSNSSNLAGIQDSYLKSQPKTLTNDKWQTKRKKKNAIFETNTRLQTLGIQLTGF